jgi:hypothetical protein
MLRGAPTLLLASALTAACGGGSGDPPSPARGSSRTAQYASAEGRWLLGLASRYPADTALAAREDALRRSQRARRAAAWEAVARALAPVTLARPAGLAGAAVPRFQTWYDRQDVARVFQRLYEGIGPAGRAASARFDDAALDEAFGYSTRFVTTLPEWPAERLERLRRVAQHAGAVAGVSGVLRVAASPDAVRHLVQSYPEVLRCINGSAPPAFVDGPAAAQQVAREPVALPACGVRRAGDLLRRHRGLRSPRASTAGAAGASLRVISEGVTRPTGVVRCSADALAGCTVQGPGTLPGARRGRAQGAQGMLDVRYQTPEAPSSRVPRRRLPARRGDGGDGVAPGTDLGPLPTFDTSAAGIARRLGPAPMPPGAWATAPPSPPTRRSTPCGCRVGEHLSPGGDAHAHARGRPLAQHHAVVVAERPDDDFGADRPAEVRALGGPWSNVQDVRRLDYDELDPDPAGGFARRAPTLGSALRAVHEGAGGPSWCSNPYIDAAPGLVRSNCVGCHQHAMSGLRPFDVQETPERFPGRGRARVRNNLPADGFWGIDAGDRLGAVLVETVDYHRVTR